MAKQWFQREELWAGLHAYMFNGERMRRTPSEVDGIIRLLELRKNDMIVDVGCGTGRHLIELASRGYAKCTGLDSMSGYLDIAKRRARKRGLELAWVHGDMHKQFAAKEFDIALCLFSSFGYFPRDADNLKVLRNIADSLRPGGKLLLDVRGKENFARNFDDRAWLRTGSSVVLSQRTANADFSRIHNKWTVISDGHSQQVRFSHWIYSAHELKSMCESAGFEQVDVFGGFDGRPYTPDASRLVVVARLT